ncbi:MAG: hypothetical protein ACPG5R_04240 [Cognaticolwellia aestuarii]
MKINYLKAIVDSGYFNALVKKSNHSDKELYLALFESALRYLKGIDYLYDNGFIDPTFIEWQIGWVLENEEILTESAFNHYVTNISNLVNDFDGYWHQQEIIDILEDEHYFAENLAITAMVYALHGMFSDDGKYLYLATKCESLIYFAAISAKSLLKAEELVQKRDEGLKKSKAKRTSKPVLDSKIDELAQAIWLEIPELSNSSVASNIYNGISNILTSYIDSKTNCQAFYELGFYNEVLTTSEEAEEGIDHPKDFNLSCIPLKLKSADAIRKQVSSFKPSTARKNNSSDSIKRIKPILRDKLPCSNPKCECRNKF